MRKVSLVENEYYHIFNRGVDKRKIFLEEKDFTRFLKSMELFNAINPIGSIFEHSFLEKAAAKLGNPVSKKLKKENLSKPLVEFVAYCLNGNHYHFILKQVAEKGIEKFMHKLGLGYSKYFNEKYERNGALFQGPFKAVFVESNEQLLHLSAYVNLNWKVHRLGNPVSKSSWEEYSSNPKSSLCNTEIISRQFKSLNDYGKFAEESIEEIINRRSIITNDLLLE